MLTIPSFMGRNNGILDHCLWKYNCEGQNGGNNCGNMMYDYGLDHGELDEHFFVLPDCPLMCEGMNSSYHRLTS